jgi:hypothetical protein
MTGRVRSRTLVETGRQQFGTDPRVNLSVNSVDQELIAEQRDHGRLEEACFRSLFALSPAGQRYLEYATPKSGFVIRCNFQNPI